MSMHMVGAVLWGALGLGCVIRGFYHPTRAIVKSGSVLRCSGDPNSFGVCDPADVIETEPGADVFAAGPGTVVAVSDYYVHIVIENDAVVVMYEGLDPTVEIGQNVGTGQKIGTSDGRVAFSVTQFKPGGVSEFVPPSAWLAVRGLTLVKKNEGQEVYCTGGREIIVPATNKTACNLKAPRKAGFALLPVTVELE